MLERIFEEFGPAARDAPPKEDSGRDAPAGRITQARIEAALGAIEAPAPRTGSGAEGLIAIAALAGRGSLVLGLVSMLGS